ncbi:MAG TPA: hypothetical protein PKV65_16310, partial [Acidovorax defluvii]|nr:hypothetical protein [Acidovorax defluvii]
NLNRSRRLFSVSEDTSVSVKEAGYINAYLVAGKEVIVEKSAKPITSISEMSFGSKPVDGGNLLLSLDELESLGLSEQ